MKNLVIFSLLVSASFMFLNFDTKEEAYFPKDISADLIEHFSQEHIETIVKESLNTQLERGFKSLFDEVSAVHAQHSDLNGYYYIVFGQKDNVEKIELLTVSKSDIEQKQYTYLDVAKLELLDAPEYCKKGLESPHVVIVCQGSCQPRPYTCLGQICGIVNNGICAPF